jgi:hypothetical protein
MKVAPALDTPIDLSNKTSHAVAHCIERNSCRYLRALHQDEEFSLACQWAPFS